MTAADRPSDTPRVGDTLTTAEQLDALPDKAVVLDEHEEPWQKLGEGQWCGRADGPMSGSALLRTRTDEVTVLYVPGEQPCRHCGSCDGPPSCPDCDHADRPSVTDDARAVREAAMDLYRALRRANPDAWAEIDEVEDWAYWEDIVRTAQLTSAAGRAEMTTATTDEAARVLDDVIQHLRKIWSTGHDEAREVIDTAEELLAQALPRLLATARTRPTREQIIDALVMSPLSDTAGTDMRPFEQTADAVLALYADQPETTTEDVLDSLPYFTFEDDDVAPDEEFVRKADVARLLATARTRPTRYEVARAIRLSRTNGLCKPGVRCDLCDCAQEYEDDLALRDADAVLALLRGGERRG